MNSLAEKLTEDQAAWLLSEIRERSAIADADNRKLLWLAMQLPFWKHAELGSTASAILTEIEDRLYPEYDGENVKLEEWGWSTQEGEIRYLPNTELSEPQT